MEKIKITKSNLAQMHGVSEGAINRWMRNGCPYEYQITGCRKIAVYDPDAVKAWINARPTPGRKPRISHANDEERSV